MLRVCTINASNYLGRGVEYTNNLYDMVRRNLPDGFEGTFTVFTDCPEGYDKGIIARPLPHAGLSGWWNKIALFKDGVFDDGDRIVYIDLSTLITGRLDKIVSYDGHFAILRDFYRPDGLQSAFMSWKSGTVSYIWDSWLAAGKPEPIGGDQSWIESAVINSDKWQDLFPGLFVSYKLSNGAVPEVASVVKFHGEPKPHEILEGWAPRVWKVGGMTRAELDNVCNTENKIIQDNIRNAMGRDLPWFDFDYSQHDGQACIVGGGPSLEANLETLRWRKDQGQKVFSSNGTHDYLISRGIIPDYHVMLDARSENVQFVKNPVKTIKYLVASQCDQSVFDALEGYDVTVFHNTTKDADQILIDEQNKPIHLLGGGTTVGIKSMLLAELMGFNTIHLFGMDSCYMNGAHHSYNQSLNDGERVLDVLYYDREFKCSGWMASQAQDFIEFCMRFLGTITVAGDGLLAYIARCGLPETAADIRAREILSRLPDGGIGAEVGVFAGDLSARLLQDQSISLIMVDSWAKHGSGDYAESGDFHATLTQQQQDNYYEMTKNVVRFANGRSRIIRKSSVEAAKDIDDNSLDFVFIDADHSYQGCRADLEAWFPKVRPGGLVSGHDYKNVEFPCFGVDRAVDEFIVANGLILDLGENFTWFTRKAESPATQLLEDNHA